MKSWHCQQCGRESKSEDRVEVLFHPCTPSRRARRYVPSDLDGTDLESVWLRVFSSFAGGYQPPTAEEAREETGDHGRRKDGSGRGFSDGVEP